MTAPIQIILNQENFIEARKAIGGGPRKDFFLNKPQEFRHHRSEIDNQISVIIKTLESRSTSNIGVLKVILRRSAWAKSHRPVKILFKPGLVRVVGGGDLGEMFVEVNPDSLRQIQDTIQHDPTSPTHDLAIRSETGAIERLELYGPSDRRRFSVEDAVERLSNPMTGGSYHVDLFDIPPQPARWDTYDPERQLLYKTFSEGLQALGNGLVARRLTVSRQDHFQISLRLGESTNPPTLFLQQSTIAQRSRQEAVIFDADISRHRRLLDFLDDHPLVRRIDLPPVITRTATGGRRPGHSTATVERSRPSTTRPLSLPSPLPDRTYPKMAIIDGGISNVLDP